MDFRLATLMGHDSDSVWVKHDNANLIAIARDGSVKIRHRWGEMGLSGEPDINDLVPFNGQLWMVAAGHLIIFDRGSWKNIGRPAPSWISEVAPTPDGGAWVRALEITY